MGITINKEILNEVNKVLEEGHMTAAILEHSVHPETTLFILQSVVNAMTEAYRKLDEE